MNSGTNGFSKKVSKRCSVDAKLWAWKFGRDLRRNLENALDKLEFLRHSKFLQRCFSDIHRPWTRIFSFQHLKFQPLIRVCVAMETDWICVNKLYCTMKKTFFCSGDGRKIAFGNLVGSSKVDWLMLNELFDKSTTGPKIEIWQMQASC